MTLNNPTDQLTAHRLSTDATGQNVNGLNGISEPFLNPSMPTFQPIVRDLLGATISAGRAGFERLPESGPMSVQQYEVTLNPNYIAD